MRVQLLNVLRARGWVSGKNDKEALSSGVRCSLRGKAGC